MPDDIAEGISHRKVYIPAIVAVGSTVAPQMAVETLTGVDMAFVVVLFTGTDYRMQGVAKSVGDRKHNDKITETACGGMAEMLCVNAWQRIRRVIGAANGSIAQMSVGIEDSPRTDGEWQGVDHGVSHRKVDSKGMDTAAGVAHNLGV